MKILKVLSAALALCLIASNAVFAATTAATIKITSPKAKSSTTNGALTLAGTSSSTVGVTNVFYSLNGSDWAAASTTNNWANWTANVALITPGPNSIAAFAANSNGGLSVTSSVTFTYQVLAPLTLQINPPGAGTVKISPKETGGMLPINQTVTLTAKAAKGFAFANWADGLGSLVTNGTALKFAMGSNSTFMANFSDVNRPVCVIVSPAAKQQVTTAAFTVTGKASDNVAIANVFYSFNGAAWQTAATANNFSNWTADVNLTLGTNTIQAFAQDTSGNNSLTNKITFVYVQATISGAWRGTQFKTPAQITLVDIGGGGFSINGGDNFALLTGSLTVNGNGTFSGNFDGAFNGTYSIGNGMVALGITSGSEPATHTLSLNAGKDFMVDVESQLDADHNHQQLILFQREPGSVTTADVAGFWNSTQLGTPARVDGPIQTDGFELSTGNVVVRIDGTLTFDLGNGPVSGTYKIGSQGLFTVKVSQNGVAQSHTLFLNANKDILINAESQTSNGDNSQHIIIFQRAPASISPSDLVGTWNASQFHTPAQIDLFGSGGGDSFSVGTGALTVNANGTFTAQFENTVTGTYVIGVNGVVTINFDGNVMPSRTLFINAGKDVMITSDSENDVNSNHQEVIIFQRAPGN